MPFYLDTQRYVRYFQRYRWDEGLQTIIIGRERERHILEGCYTTDKSEFVLVYGRRRVGKTFLVRESFEERFAFYATGVLNGNRETQLQTWNMQMSHYGGEGFAKAQNWIEAFENLRLLIESVPLLYTISGESWL